MSGTEKITSHNEMAPQSSHLGRFDFNTLSNNYHRATQLGRFTLWHYGRLATQLSRFNLWPMDAKLHNSLVNLLCGTTAAELNNPVRMH